MAKSPGHEKFPDHSVQESPLSERVKVLVDDTVVADSTQVIKVDEDGHPVRYYFPRSDVKMELLEPTETRTTCPFKGEASYFDIKLDGLELSDAVWTYPEPYDEHQRLRDRVAFYEDRFPQIVIDEQRP